MQAKFWPLALLALLAACGGGDDDDDDDSSADSASCEDVGTLSGRLGPHDSGDPTPAEQLVLELLNRARAAPGAEAVRYHIELDEGVDEPLEDGPRPPLAMNATLLDVARAHSADMIARDFFEHENPDGDDPFDRMEAGGYEFMVAAENLYLSLSTGTLTENGEAPGAHEGLFVDEGYPGRGHRVNMMLADVTEVGMGIAKGEFTDSGDDWNGVAFTQDFGAPPGANPLLLGVVYRDDDGDGAYDAGEGLEGVTVTATGDEAETLETGASGGWAFEVEASGTFTIEVEGDGVSECVTAEVDDLSVKADVVVE